MATERKSCTEGFKREAVRLMESSGKPVAQLARDPGIHDNNLYRWRGVYGRPSQADTSSSVATAARWRLKPTLYPERVSYPPPNWVKTTAAIVMPSGEASAYNL